MTDDLLIGIVFVLCDEFFSAGKGNLVDVFFDFLGSHTDAGIADAERFRFFINRYCNSSFCFAAVFTRAGQHTELTDGIHTVRN